MPKKPKPKSKSKKSLVRLTTSINSPEPDEVIENCEVLVSGTAAPDVRLQITVTQDGQTVACPSSWDALDEATADGNGDYGVNVCLCGQSLEDASRVKVEVCELDENGDPTVCSAVYVTISGDCTEC